MPPLKRFLNLEEDVRQHILDLAREQFEQHGYDSMSLNDLIRSLEISKGQFYYWFEDKADLFLTVMDTPVEGFQATFLSQGQPKSKGDFWKHMQRVDDACGEWFYANMHHIPLWARVMELPHTHELNEQLDAKFQPVTAHITQTLELGQGWGLVRTDIPVDRMLDLLNLIREGFDMFELENSQQLTERQLLAVHRLRTKVTRSLLESE